MPEQVVEVRCPSSFRRLFVKLRLEGDRPRITEGNLMEFACADCRRGTGHKLVLHRYDLLGNLVETVTVD
jgi:hypothetical protein